MSTVLDGVIVGMVFFFGTVILTFLILVFVRLYDSDDSGEGGPSLDILTPAETRQRFNGFDSTGGVQLHGNEPVTIPIDREVYSQPNLYRTTDQGHLAFLESGTYEVSYHAQVETLSHEGGQLATYTSFLQLNNITLQGSQSSCFLRKQPNAALSCGCSNTLVIVAQRGDVIQLQVSRTSGTTSAQTRSGESSLSVLKIE